MTSLHFSVTGEFITKFARDRYLETASIDTAVQFLTKSLIGFPDNLAKLVVTGKKKLVGTDEVTIEDDNQTIEPYSWIKPRPIEECLCGWIAPNGYVFGASAYTQTTEHDDLADRIVERGDVKLGDEISNYRAVEKAGWVKFSPHLIVADAEPSGITEAQRRQVLLFLNKQGISNIQVGYGNSGSRNHCFSKNSIAEMDLYLFAMYLTGRDREYATIRY